LPAAVSPGTGAPKVTGPGRAYIDDRRSMTAATETQTMPTVRRPASKGQDLLRDDGFRRASRTEGEGVMVKIRLPSYRSLPLSCITELTMSIDDRAVADDDLLLLLDGNAHRIRDLAERIDLWWFVLDAAEVFAPFESDLEDGMYCVEVGLRVVVPYATGGKTAVSHTCVKSLRLGPE
jgi:hypothetical protein